VARERIACELRLGGCWELTHRRESDSRGRLWRDGDAWLYISDTVPGGTVDPGALVSGLGRAARDAGASLHEDARVLRIEPGPPARARAAPGPRRGRPRRRRADRLPRGAGPAPDPAGPRAPARARPRSHRRARARRARARRRHALLPPRPAVSLGPDHRRRAP